MNEEEFYLHAHKDMKIEIENNLTTIFKGDEIHKVEKGNRTVKVLEGSEDHLVEKDRVVTINGDEIKIILRILRKILMGTLSVMLKETIPIILKVTYR